MYTLMLATWAVDDWLAGCAIPDWLTQNTQKVQGAAENRFNAEGSTQVVTNSARTMANRHHQGMLAAEAGNMAHQAKQPQK